MGRDTLSDLLGAVRLRGAVFYYVSCWRDWATEAPPAREIAAAVMPGADQVMAFHMVARGSAWAAVSGDAPLRLAAGDIVVLPHGDAHVMSSAPGLLDKKSTDYFAPPIDNVQICLYIYTTLKHEHKRARRCT